MLNENNNEILACLRNENLKSIQNLANYGITVNLLLEFKLEKNVINKN